MRQWLVTDTRAHGPFLYGLKSRKVDLPTFHDLMRAVFAFDANPRDFPLRKCDHNALYSLAALQLCANVR